MLYDTDFAKWAEEQAAHLTEGRFDLLDMGNLIEEVADLGRRQLEIGRASCRERV